MSGQVWSKHLKGRLKGTCPPKRNTFFWLRAHFQARSSITCRIFFPLFQSISPSALHPVWTTAAIQTQSNTGRWEIMIIWFTFHEINICWSGQPTCGGCITANKKRGGGSFFSTVVFLIPWAREQSDVTIGDRPLRNCFQRLSFWFNEQENNLKSI